MTPAIEREAIVSDLVDLLERSRSEGNELLSERHEAEDVEAAATTRVTQAGAAAHYLDGVVLDLAALRGRTGSEEVRVLLSRCEARCEAAQGEFGQCVALLERIAADPEDIAGAKRDLEVALGFAEPLGMRELLQVATVVITEATLAATESIPLR